MTAAGTLTTYTEHCSMPGAELSPICSPDAVRGDHLTGQYHPKSTTAAKDTAR